jgi:hypothetical protein
MNKDILVTILEDDVFSQNWMALLLVRDWRTRVIAEFGTRVELCEFLEKDYAPFDILIMDVDLFGEIYSVDDICDLLSENSNSAKILLTGVEPNPRIVKLLENDRVVGYVLKGEVGYSLSWIISFAFDGVKAKLKSPIVQQSRNVLIWHMNRFTIDPMSIISPGVILSWFIS